jgi:lipid II isoglutaminyl synthase (glutamine-hydrolysing)
MVTIMKLTIAWLYGAKMNIYGDRGNVICLERRARWRGIETTVIEVGIGDPIPSSAGVFFFGGGQDNQQIAVSKDLQGSKGVELKAAVNDGAALLAVCGGYQLLGHEYRPHASEALPGIGLFDAVSVAGPTRAIGNVVVNSQWGELVGFENHSGLTTLNPGQAPLGTVKIGRGNNGTDGTEGALYKHAAGCYLHGSLLPKNPTLADWLIAAALAREYGTVELAPLDDGIELAAHDAAVARGAAR